MRENFFQIIEKSRKTFLSIKEPTASDTKKERKFRKSITGEKNSRKKRERTHELVPDVQKPSCPE